MMNNHNTNYWWTKLLNWYNQHNYNNLDRFILDKLACYYLNLERYQIYQQSPKITFHNYLKIKHNLKQIAHGYPLAYIINKIHILDNDFYVNKDVLVPRQETEELIVKAIKKINNLFPKQKQLKILDLCTGSLVIGSLLQSHFPDAKVSASDISLKALKVAKVNNATLNNNKITLIKSDLLKYHIQNNLKYDIIISNPPYIIKGDNNTECINFEPKIALFAKDEGLFFYKQIFINLKFVINNPGLIILEIGYNQKSAIEKLLLEFCSIRYSFYFETDISNKFRFLYICHL